MITFNVITIFPDMIDSYSNESILGRGQKAKAIRINAINLRDFTDNKRKTVDDTPYGGGAGMVMKPEPIYKALHSLDAIPFRKADGLTRLKKIFSFAKKSALGGSAWGGKRTILLSPRGRQFDQRIAEEWSKFDEITFVCGRYEGIDERVVEHMVDEEISIGPYVLAGGELGALVMIEAISRLIPGVLGNEESLKEETFNTQAFGHLSTTAEKNKSAPVLQCSSAQVTKEYPQYTKPADFKGWKVPDVLLSGDHKKIEEWRRKKSSE